MTPAEAVVVLRGIPRALGQAQRSGLGKGLRPVALEAQRAASQRGILRALLHGNTHGPVMGKARSAGKSLFTVSTRLMPDGTTAIGKISALGLAGLQETGGRTKPHDIRSSRASHFLGAVGRIAASTKNKPVRHPGSRIKAIPTLEMTLRRNEPRIIAELEKAIQAAADRIDRAA